MSNNTIRYCKKCGCELMSTNRHKTCENCRRKNMGTIKNFIKAAVTTVSMIGIVIFSKSKGGSKGD